MQKHPIDKSSFIKYFKKVKTPKDIADLLKQNNHVDINYDYEEMYSYYTQLNQLFHSNMANKSTNLDRHKICSIFLLTVLQEQPIKERYPEKSNEEKKDNFILANAILA